MKKEAKEKQTNVQKGAECYREKIVEMIEQIENEEYIISIYSFIKVFFED